MSSTLKSLRALSDPTRLRIVALLEKDELSVNELQEITHMGQSRISTHLGLLQDAELVQSRREGKRTFYRLNQAADGTAREFIDVAVRGAKEMPEQAADQVNLKRILARRNDQQQLYFNQIAGRFDRSYGPGRSWQAFGQMLLRVLPPVVVADLGAGEGLLSELLARRCKKVIAVDNSEKIVAFGAAKAKKNGLKNLEFRLGDLQAPPIDPQSVDLVVLSQALHHAKEPDKIDHHVVNMWKSGQWKAFCEMLPEYASKGHGEGSMHDTAMLLGALGWSSYDGQVEVLTPYFGASGTGQINAVFPVTAQSGDSIPAAQASSASAFQAVSRL